MCRGNSLWTWEVSLDKATLVSHGKLSIADPLNIKVGMFFPPTAFKGLMKVHCHLVGGFLSDYFLWLQFLAIRIVAPTLFGEGHGHPSISYALILTHLGVSSFSVGTHLVGCFKGKPKGTPTSFCGSLEKQFPPLTRMNTPFGGLLSKSGTSLLSLVRAPN